MMKNAVHAYAIVRCDNFLLSGDECLTIDKLKTIITVKKIVSSQDYAEKEV